MSAENAGPEVRNLKQRLQYQEKVVVSRILIKNPARSKSRGSQFKMLLIMIRGVG